MVTRTKGARPDLERGLSLELLRKLESLAGEMLAVSREIDVRLERAVASVPGRVGAMWPRGDDGETLHAAADLADELRGPPREVLGHLVAWLPVESQNHGPRDMAILARLSDLDDATLGPACLEAGCGRRKIDGTVACECGELWCPAHMSEHQRTEKHGTEART